MSEEPTAVVRDVDGQLVLDDPVAVAVIRAVEKVNCRNTFDGNAERIVHFKHRVAERGLSAADVVIVILNVDDIYGGPIAGQLMPGANWQEFRDRGEIPFARGLAGREGIQEIIGFFDREAAEKLEKMTDVVAVVVVDHGVSEVFPV